MRPLVLVTADRRNGVGFIDSPRVRPKRDEVWVKEAYVEAVRAAGGTPLVLPPGEIDLDDLLPRVDAVVLTGGDMDIHPSWYGESIEGRLDRVEEKRTALEIGVARWCLEHDLPVLGICGGMQVLAVAAGGSLIQDLPVPTEAQPDILRHEQLTDDATTHHAVRLAAPVDQWMGGSVQVNSTHHQAIKSPGSFTICGWAPDDVVEVIAHPTHRFAVGVQWHPEILGDIRLYEALIAACRA